MLAGPLGDEACQIGHGAKKIEPSKSGGIKDLHEHFGGDWLEYSCWRSIGRILEHLSEFLVLVLRTRHGALSTGLRSLICGSLFHCFKGAFGEHALTETAAIPIFSFADGSLG